MYKDLNPILHSQLRLAIISFLVSSGKSDFSELKKLTSATSGNISVQLKKLEEAGYIVLRKGFLNNYQHTSVEITKTGIDTFEKYVEAIRTIPSSRIGLGWSKNAVQTKVAVSVGF